MRAAWRVAPWAAIAMGAAVVCACVWQAGLGADHALGLLFSRTQPFMHWEAAAWRPSDDRIGARAQMIRAALFGPDPSAQLFHETETLQAPLLLPSAATTFWHSKKPDLWFRTDGFEWIRFAGEWPGLAAEVTFPAEPRAAAEPLFAAGNASITADTAGVRYGAVTAGGRTVTIFGEHWGSSRPCEGPAVEIKPGHAYRMKFSSPNPCDNSR